MVEQIGGPTVDRFELRREPNGVYHVNGRVIPVSDDSIRTIDHGKSVVPVHDLQYSRIGLVGVERCVDVKK